MGTSLWMKPMLTEYTARMAGGWFLSGGWRIEYSPDCIHSERTWVLQEVCQFSANVAFFRNTETSPNIAVILTTPWIREHLINYARTLIYTTSMPVYNVHAKRYAIYIHKEGTVQMFTICLT